MANIFTLENVQDFSDKLNIDDLYEKKRQHDVHQLDLFNKILNRIHVRIKTTSKQKTDSQFCWFLVPEMIIGVPKYDQAACIAYVIDKLKTNGFNVRYIHPNTLFISWGHWVPAYVRTELKKQTGIVVNELGTRIYEQNEESNKTKFMNNFDSPNELIQTINAPDKIMKLNTKEYTPIKSYKPAGNLIYNDSMLNRIEEKIN
jgi:hypothetical protein